MSSLSMLPASDDDLETTWNYIQCTISKYMDSGISSGLTMEDYMGLYTAVNNFCTSRTGPVNERYRGGHGEELYHKLVKYLTAHLEDLVQECRGHTGEALLQFYIKEWNHYTIAAEYINHPFTYLNRHWVKRELDEGKRNIYDVHTLYLVKWGQVLLEQVHSKVMDAVLQLVEKQRNGEVIDHWQIEDVADSFVLVGIDETDPTQSTLDVYRSYFESPMLEATGKFYRAESQKFISENSMVEYMKKAETWLDEEDERLRTYLHLDTECSLKRTCYQSLITEHSVLLKLEFQVLLDNNQEEDMSRMYNLLSRIPDGLEYPEQQFESHVRKAGLSAMQKVSLDVEKLEPKVYVDALLESLTKYQPLLKKVFRDDPRFTEALSRACKDIVNHNEVCKSNSNNSPELLAKYTYVLLSKGGNIIKESELEAVLTQIMTVFNCIEDKDVFQKFYTRMLVRRLVYANSSSDSAEASMISKLKEACGFGYTYKLQRILQDIQISKDLSTSYRSYVASLELDESEVLESTYSILGTAFWPLSAPATKFNPPQEIEADFSRFIRFYNSNHDSRKLMWLWNLCRGDLRANYTLNGETPYTFHVSLYQMGILLLFNDKDEYTYEDIVAMTQLNPEVLEQAMATILEAKVLIMIPDGSKTAPGRTFQLNTSFQNKNIRINLNRTGVKETNKTINEDRKILIQSAVIRIMKARKRIKHAQLVSETFNQIKSRFNPEIPDIERCIEILLNKEYLERLDDELAYLA